jgi:hypothetical protein
MCMTDDCMSKKKEILFSYVNKHEQGLVIIHLDFLYYSLNNKREKQRNDIYHLYVVTILSTRMMIGEIFHQHNRITYVADMLEN